MTEVYPDEAYGVMARFESAEGLLMAAKTLRADGVMQVEAYAPYPVEGLAEFVGRPERASRGVAITSFVSAAVAGIATYAMQWYSATYAYPFVVGGKPLDGWAPFMPATVAMVLLFAVIGAWLGMAALNRLPKPYHPAFNVAEFAKASSDGFFLLVSHPADREKNNGEIEKRLRDLGAASIDEVPK